MKRLLTAVLGCALAVSSVVVPASANSSMPTIWSSSQADSKIESVQHRRHHGHGYYGPRRHHNYGGAAAAAGIIGLAAGAAIAAGAAERERDRRYYEDREWDRYCFSRYKSYDPRTGTYLGYDGYRRPCR